MNSRKVDLLVIGAGASGSCIAYEAIKRGLKVALLEAFDIGAGTSSRSTKLLHGGVRYLELAFKTFDCGQLRLVKEALQERSYWLQNASFLANSLELVLPTKSLLQSGYYRAGLSIYDALAGKSNINSSHFLSKSELRKSLPLLRDDLNGGVAYSDGQFNDARLNLLLALTAEKAGVIVRTRCKVIELLKENGKVYGAISKDRNGLEERWSANAVVNATGIHVDKIRQMADKDAAPRIFTSRGIHIIIEQNLCPDGMGLLIPSTEDGRVLFCLPFHGKTQIGTTDTPCEIDHSRQPSEHEKNYLLTYIKKWFPNVSSPQIQSCWAGARPLLRPSADSINSSRLVREHEIEILPCGLISAIGGKWTTCRTIALDTLKVIEDKLSIKISKPINIPLLGVSSNADNSRKELLLQQHKIKDCLPDTKLREKQIKHLQANYGLEALRIISKSPHQERLPMSEVIPLCQAEIKHSIQHEHAYTSTDLLARRCRLAMVDYSEAKRIAPIVNEHLEKAGLDIETLNLEL